MEEKIALKPLKNQLIIMIIIQILFLTFKKIPTILIPSNVGNISLVFTIMY